MLKSNCIQIISTLNISNGAAIQKGDFNRDLFSTNMYIMIYKYLDTIYTKVKDAQIESGEAYYKT